MGGFLLIIGKSLFSLGAKVGIELFGKRLGTSLGKRSNIVIFVITIFLIGFVLTLSEPDLLVLAGELPSIPKSVLVICVSIMVAKVWKFRKESLEVIRATCREVKRLLFGGNCDNSQLISNCSIIEKVLVFVKISLTTTIYIDV